MLERYFDSRLGFSDRELEGDFSKKLSNAKYRRELIQELESTLVDPDVSWVEWFTGNHVEDDFENEADARAFAKEQHTPEYIFTELPKQFLTHLAFQKQQEFL